MSHWTHLITEDDISATPEQWEVEEAWEAERVALCNADNEAARNDIPVPEGFDEALEEAQERRAQWLDQQKAEWKAFLDSLPAWQRQWDEASLRRLKERKERHNE